MEFDCSTHSFLGPDSLESSNLCSYFLIIKRRLFIKSAEQPCTVSNSSIRSSGTSRGVTWPVLRCHLSSSAPFLWSRIRSRKTQPSRKRCFSFLSPFFCFARRSDRSLPRPPQQPRRYPHLNLPA